MADVITSLDDIDEDLRAASADRAAAWRALCLKDTPKNREAYKDSCVQVDGLLEMRHGMASEG